MPDETMAKIREVLIEFGLTTDATHKTGTHDRPALVDQATAALSALVAEAVQEANASKDNAYWERNQLVTFLSRLYPAHLARHPEEDTDWEDDWRTIVCVHIPIRKKVVAGDQHNQVPQKYWFETVESQATWHIHDSQAQDFSHLAFAPGHWDGHTTAEKYHRIKSLGGGQD